MFIVEDIIWEINKTFSGQNLIFIIHIVLYFISSPQWLARPFQLRSLTYGGGSGRNHTIAFYCNTLLWNSRNRQIYLFEYNKYHNQYTHCRVRVYMLLTVLHIRVILPGPLWYWNRNIPENYVRAWPPDYPHQIINSSGVGHVGQTCICILTRNTATTCFTSFRRNGANYIPHSKVHGANMGPTWVLSSPGGPMLAPGNFLSGMLCFLG